MSAAKKKNPLYVVTNNGQDVEEATNIFDVWVKKFGLEPVMQILSSLVDLLSDQVGNYGFFIFLQEFIDQLVENLMELKDRVSSFIPLFS